ncbi:hypothetical protein M0R45_015995 [Rubus argutus]|uniref:CCHC-type domain-containing protein n=1 Tax=Rubus argutus TaxID=59490 RepID=A0AAW1XSM6_RUBAR
MSGDQRGGPRRATSDSTLESGAGPEGAKKVLCGGPWHVENHRFNIVSWPYNSTINDVPHHMVSYWVHISGLTLEKMNKGNARLIGSEIGDVIELENIKPEDAFLRSYLRVKININSQKPLPTSFWLHVSNYASHRVEYLYEGLCTFCWKCAMLGHSINDCRTSSIYEPDVHIWFGP